jgi:hypothetical protein
MAHRLIVSDNRDDPCNPLVLDGEAIDAAARDPLAIGKLMVDQVWAEGTDPTGGGLYYERNSNQHRRLQAKRLTDLSCSDASRADALEESLVFVLTQLQPRCSRWHCRCCCISW